ncbi:DBH-like monooxygenase protein 2-like [Exaiptasia diaphana]|nr:DBH-like monooxygenase protein 2-like [Exaiptasia diaphana]
MIPNTVYFKYVAKTTGWAALGWSKTASGGQMIQYDIALGGVRNTNESYLKDYYSSTLGKPTYDDDVRQNLILTSATESGGFTTIEFNRETDTGDTGYDVPIQVRLDWTAFE